MPEIKDASPRLTVLLYKTISRKTVDGKTVVSARYAGKDPFIDLTPFLNDRSSVNTTKSVREPAGGFSLTFADAAQTSFASAFGYVSNSELESIYGLVEPMDLVEIRMWNGLGKAPETYPIIMRGFVSEISRSQTVGSDGHPQRQVTVSGQDYGKIWQMIQVIYLAAFAEGNALLTNFALWELFGVEAVNAMPAGEFVRQMVEKIINPYLDGILPTFWPGIPRLVLTGDSISVKHGVLSQSFQESQGSIYDIMKLHGDVGVWNELYTEDREDGVYCVYRSVPAMHLTRPPGGTTDLIIDDAVDPEFAHIQDSMVETISVSRSDANVANFFWVENARYDMVNDMQRKLSSIPKDDGSVVLRGHPNSDPAYYGLRPMYASTQQGEDSLTSMTSGRAAAQVGADLTKQVSWVTKRREQMRDMNRDNVVLERGTARVKGGPTRFDGSPMKAGDYVQFQTGRIRFLAYVVSLTHEFMPFNSYTTTLTFERGTGFTERIQMDSGKGSPWLAEQASYPLDVVPTPEYTGDWT